METVTRKQRSSAGRLGMLRQWTLDAALRLVKVGTGDMRSGILTKLALTGDAEAREPAAGAASVVD